MGIRSCSVSKRFSLFWSEGGGLFEFQTPTPPPPPSPQTPASDGPEQGASTTRNCFGGCLPRGRCDPDGAAVPLPYQVLHTRSRGECDVLWQTSPVSIPADLVLWSSGSALTLCIMSRTVHRRLCASAAAARCGTCSACHCLRVSADTPLTALRGARHAPRSGPWNDMVWVRVRECGPEAPGVTPARVPKECGYGNFTRRSGTGSVVVCVAPSPARGSLWHKPLTRRVGLATCLAGVGHTPIPSHPSPRHPKVFEPVFLQIKISGESVGAEDAEILLPSARHLEKGRGTTIFQLSRL